MQIMHTSDHGRNTSQKKNFSQKRMTEYPCSSHLSFGTFAPHDYTGGKF